MTGESKGEGYVIGSGNVADLGLPKPEEDLRKAQIAHRKGLRRIRDSASEEDEATRQRRREALDELTKEAQEMGFYHN